MCPTIVARDDRDELLALEILSSIWRTVGVSPYREADLQINEVRPEEHQ